MAKAPEIGPKAIIRSSPSWKACSGAPHSISQASTYVGGCGSTLPSLTSLNNIIDTSQPVNLCKTPESYRGREDRRDMTPDEDLSHCPQILSRSSEAWAHGEKEEADSLHTTWMLDWGPQTGSPPANHIRSPLCADQVFFKRSHGLEQLMTKKI